MPLILNASAGEKDVPLSKEFLLCFSARIKISGEL